MEPSGTAGVGDEVSERARPSDTGKHGDPILQADNVTVAFGGVTALAEVSIDFYPGEICGLIGPNGAGKTTLFDCLSGIRAPRSGSISFHQHNITGRSATWRARHGIRRTFQRQQTFGWLTVEDNLLVALEWRSGGGGLAADLVHLPTRIWREEKRRQRARRVLELCGIADLREAPAANLPIGRARMVEVARAVVDSPRVLLLDEPTSGLEESEADNLGGVMQRLRDEEGCAVVLVEHDVGFVMRQCDRIVVLNLGAVIADDVPEEIRNDAAVGAAYLG
jgi:branched-chain amino acid transport system ATP-binding protein